MKKLFKILPILITPFLIASCAVKASAPSTPTDDSVPSDTTTDPVDEVKHVSEVTLNKNSLTLQEGESETLSATVAPIDATNKKVAWTSSQTSYATINSDGKVTAVKAGSSTITVTTEDGNKTATCRVTVTAKPAEVTLSNITLSNKTTSYDVNDTFVKPTVTAKYSDNSTKDVTEATTFSGYDMSKAGTYTVTASYTEKQVTKTTTYSIEVKQKINTDGFELLSDDTIPVGSEVVFTSGYNGAVYAMSDTQNNNNRGVVSITASGGDIALVDDVATLVVEEGTKAGTYSFYDEVHHGYLYAASSSSNFLRTTSTKSDNASFALKSNSNGQVKLVAQGSYTRNTIKHNKSSSSNIFSCYASDGTSGNLPYLFVKPSTPIYASSITIEGGNEVYVGSDIDLYVDFNPSETNRKSITWTSDATNVATVTNGTVHGVSEGSATITATVQGENGTTVSDTHVIQVKPVNVTGVTLNKTSATVTLGKTLQLTATVAPSNATNKNVTWKSNDTTIATVSSSGLVTASSTKTGTTTVVATTVDGSFTASCSIEVSEVQMDEWTILIYMCGADLESQHGLATSDLKEIASVSGQPEDVNIVIQAGGASSWRSTYSSVISASKLNRFHLANKSYVKDEQISLASMGSTSTFQSFLEWGLTNYPAEKTGVILWNHGGGLQGVCYDEKSNDDSLLNYEVTNAVSGALKKCGMEGQKLEWIGYDACLMQLQDIAEMNSPYFNYMIASEESEAGEGWDYDTWVDDLFAKKETPTILKAICDGFIADNGGTSSSYNDQTLSYLNLSYADEYLTAWEGMATQLKNKITSSNKSSFKSLVSSCKHYADSDYTYFGLFDAKDFVNKLQNNSTFKVDATYADAVKSAHTNLVAYSTKGAGAGNSNGLCMYWPISSTTASYNTYTSTTTHFATWRSLASSYGG